MALAPSTTTGLNLGPHTARASCDGNRVHVDCSRRRHSHSRPGPVWPPVRVTFPTCRRHCPAGPHSLGIEANRSSAVSNPSHGFWRPNRLLVSKRQGRGLQTAHLGWPRPPGHREPCATLLPRHSAQRGPTPQEETDAFRGDSSQTSFWRVRWVGRGGV